MGRARYALWLPDRDQIPRALRPTFDELVRLDVSAGWTHGDAMRRSYRAMQVKIEAAQREQAGRLFEI